MESIRLDLVVVADAWLSMHNQDPATARARSLEQPVEHDTLAFPSDQVLPGGPNL